MFVQLILLQNSSQISASYLIFGKSVFFDKSYSSHVASFICGLFVCLKIAWLVDTMQDSFCLNSAHKERAVCGVYIGRLCKVEYKLGNRIGKNGTKDWEENERLL
jgi:hypothetical protein